MKNLRKYATYALIAASSALSGCNTIIQGAYGMGKGMKMDWDSTTSNIRTEYTKDKEYKPSDKNKEKSDKERLTPQELEDYLNEPLRDSHRERIQLNQEYY